WDMRANALPRARPVQGPGSELWHRVEVSGDSAYGVAVSPDSRVVYVTGCSGDLACSQDILTAAYETDSGRLLWSTIYDGGPGGDEAFGLALSPDGADVFVTGIIRGHPID